MQRWGCDKDVTLAPSLKAKPPPLPSLSSSACTVRTHIGCLCFLVPGLNEMVVYKVGILQQAENVVNVSKCTVICFCLFCLHSEILHSPLHPKSPPCRIPFL